MREGLVVYAYDPPFICLSRLVHALCLSVRILLLSQSPGYGRTRLQDSEQTLFSMDYAGKCLVYRLGSVSYLWMTITALLF